MFGIHEMLVELALEDAVDAACLLLFLQLQAELAFLASPSHGARSLAGRCRAALDGTLWRETPFAFEKQLHALPAAESAHRSRVASHSGMPPACGQAARAARNRLRGATCVRLWTEQSKGSEQSRHHVRRLR